MNVKAADIAWKSPSEITERAPIDATSPDNAKIASLWGNPHDEGPSGFLVKLPAGSATVIPSHGSTFRAVVIQGSPAHHAEGGSEATIIEPASFISANDASAKVSCESTRDCIFYVRTEAPAIR